MTGSVTLMTTEEILQLYSQTIFNNQELQQQHNPYGQEMRELASIENGDLEALKQSLEETFTGKLGRLARSELRNAKNLGIVVATLASRSAIRGGVIPEIAFTLCDAYIQKIEELNDIDTVNQMILQCKYQYTQLVAEVKKLGRTDGKHLPHSQINRCKNYIISHLHQRLQVQDIAEALHTSPTYLADLFREHEGQTITDFILQEKIKLAKNMLIYSQYSYSDIASYLGFSSQSHLGTRFKKATGLTLRQYREQYGQKEFW